MVDGNYGLTSDSCRRMIIQFRILLESLIVLGVLTDYREAMVNFVQYIYTIFYKNRKSNQTRVSKFSQN